MRAKAGKGMILILSLVSILTITFDVIAVLAPSSNIIIAAYGSTPTIDGLIEAGEWDDAYTVRFSITGGANCTVYAKQDGANLYVGFSIPDVTYNGSDCCGIMFDVNHDEHTSLQTDDIWIHISRKGGREEKNVTRQNGMGWFKTLVSGWTAKAGSKASGWQSEYNISYSKLDVTAGANKTLGVMFLIVDKHVMGYYVWPSTASISKPVTWGDMTADTRPPTVSIVSPENKTYSVTRVPLTFTLSESASWIGYCLDSEMNVTVGGNTTLSGLSDGAHSLLVFANDTSGNTGASGTVYFTVDTTPPNVEILSPENKTYPTGSVPLSFTVDEATTWIGYSLDGQMNVTITGNATLFALLDGLHSLIVCASDVVGNIGFSIKVYFTIDTTPPSILIVSPENKTYATTGVPLTFTTDESVLWMAYSLDNNANMTITGNTTLPGLSDGSHSLTVYAKDTSGNTGVSEIIHFSITIRQELLPAWIVGAILAIVGVGAAFFVYFVRFKKGEEDTRIY